MLLPAPQKKIKLGRLLAWTCGNKLIGQPKIIIINRLSETRSISKNIYETLLGLDVLLSYQYFDSKVTIRINPPFIIYNLLASNVIYKLLIKLK